MNSHLPAGRSAASPEALPREDGGVACEKQRKKVMAIRRMEEALALLDEMDEGDLDPAAHIQRALIRAKKELRETYRSAMGVVWLSRPVAIRARLLAAREARRRPAVIGRQKS